MLARRPIYTIRHLFVDGKYINLTYLILVPWRDLD